MSRVRPYWLFVTDLVELLEELDTYVTKFTLHESGVVDYLWRTREGPSKLYKGLRKTTIGYIQPDAKRACEVITGEDLIMLQAVAVPTPSGWRMEMRYVVFF